MWQNWHKSVQKIIFALLLVNTCLLAAMILPPLFGFPGLFSQNEARLLTMDIPVQQDGGGLFGNIRLSTEQGLTLSQARLLLNGQVAGDFSSGEALLRVYEGDELSIDASAYQRELRFHINAISSNIDSVTLPPLIITEGNIITLPPVKFK